MGVPNAWPQYGDKKENKKERKEDKEKTKSNVTR